MNKNRGFRPYFGIGLANHLSMGLYSLSALGGTPSELVRFADAHWAALEPLPANPGSKMLREDWQARLGQREALASYCGFFEREVLELGCEGALRRYLPGLLPGLSAAGFHGLIRTAYGVRFGDELEVSDGLAYWATEFSSVGRSRSPGDQEEARAVYERIRAHEALGRAVPGRGLIVEAQRKALALPGFDLVVDALRPTDNTLAQLAALTVRLYLTSGDFYTLHTVTGVHAYRLLEPFIDAREEGLRHLWRALAATFIGAGTPAPVEEASGEVPTWEQSAMKARLSLEEHDLKLVDIIGEEAAFYGDETMYRRAAARRVA